MIKVREHGQAFRSRNPSDNKWSTMIVVVWEELGNRGGSVNRSLSDSSAVLDRLLGEETGLPTIRTHSQPVLVDKVHLCPVGMELPGYINRELHSRPQMWNQVDRPPRNVDGRPTYFKTLLADNPAEDRDVRDSNEVLSRTNPELFQNMQVRSTDRIAVETKEYKDPGFSEEDIRARKSLFVMES